MNRIPFFPMRPVNGGALETAIKLGALNPLLHGERLAEPKFNGWRLLVDRFAVRKSLHGESAGPYAWNRHGEASSLCLSKEQIAAPFSYLAELPETFPRYVDCEALSRRHGLMRGSLIVLDAIHDEAAGRQLGEITYAGRRKIMEAHLIEFTGSDIRSEVPLVRLVPTCPSAGALDFYHRLQDINDAHGLSGLNSFYEGLVIKSADSFYPRQNISPERETASWVKHRFA